jgi:hypothetical protein
MENTTTENTNMENNCKFVSSRGILKSCTFHCLTPVSHNNYDTIKQADILYLNNINEFNSFHGMSIYICNVVLKYFILNILPFIKHNFYLVSGDSDMTVPNDVLTQDMFNILVYNPYLIKWFSQNCVIRHDKITNLPIGLDYHTFNYILSPPYYRNPIPLWNTSNISLLPIEQENILINIKNSAVSFYDRIPKIYANLNLENDRFRQRKLLFKQIPNHLLIHARKTIDRTLLWQEMIKYAFVVSPPGVGIDCHRTYEALCLGCIPIVIGEFLNTIFKDLPVLTVKTWSNITPELLNKTLIDFKNKTFNYEKLELQYWTSQFTLDKTK